MEFGQFAELLKKLQAEEMALGETKGKEYVHNDDRLDNFKHLEGMIGVNAKKVCWVYLQKHLDSIMRYVKTSEVLSEDIRGRIVDARHYLALLYGLIVEEQEEQGEIK